MTHGASNPTHLRSWEWWLAALVGMAAAAFGAYGLWLYDTTHLDHADIWSVAYHTLQLFALHAPHLEHPVPWQLNLGRWLAAAIVMGAVVRALLSIFRSECRLFWARTRRGHIVICGLGRLGMQLALEFRRAGQRVVAIEESGSVSQIATAQDAGVAVVIGDACSLGTLSSAVVGRASKVIAVCDDEQKNVAIAAKVGELVAGPSHESSGMVGTSGADSPLECWMFIAEPGLRQAFQRDRLFPYTGPHYHVNVRGLDLFELAARQILRKAPLDFERIKPEDPTVVHLVIVGFGSMGRHLALQAARIGHFANFQKLRVTVIEQRDSNRPGDFLARHPRFREVCEFTFKPVDMPKELFDSGTVIRALPPLDVEKELVTVAVCWDSPGKRRSDNSDFLHGLEQDDAANLSVALALPHGHRPVLVFQTRRTGFAALFPVQGRGNAIGPHLHAFGMLEDTLTLETLLHEREDAIAKVLHQDYYDKQLEAGEKPGSRPAIFLWDNLAGRFKDSNRRAADHIRVKMRAIGYRVEERREDRPSVQTFDHDQLELLARMEHESYWAEWMLDTFTHGSGEQDDVAKTKPYLVPWDQLEENVKGWDRSQVVKIPEALWRAGYGIYPQVQ